MEDAFYTELKSWINEKLDNGDRKDDILKCLRAFGVMAIQDYRAMIKGVRDGSEVECESKDY